MNAVVLAATVWGLLASTSGGDGTIAVFGVTGQAPPAVRTEMTEGLRAASASLGYRVKNGPDTDAVLAGAAALGADCPLTSDACVVQMAGLTGAQVVVVGELRRDTLVVRSFNVGLSRQTGSATVPLASSANLTARLAMVRLLRPDLEVGQLNVDVDVAGATVIIDNVNRGVSPIDLVTLAPGKHEVYVAHVDFDSQTHQADVSFGNTTTLEVRLDPRPPGDRPPPHTADDDDAFRRVVVLDVLANGFPPLSGPLSTMALVEEMQKLDNVIVIGPAELSGLMGPGGIEALSTCGDGICLTSAISAVVAADEVVLVEVHNVEPRPLIFARRLDVRSSERVESAELMLDANADALAIGESMTSVVGRLFPSARMRQGERRGLSTSTRRRFQPAPVPLLVWGGSVAGLVIGGVVGVVGAASYQTAINEGRDTTAPAIMLVGGAVVAGVGLAATIIEAPFVDWWGDAAANDALLAR